MGNLVDVIPSVDSLPDDPAISRVDRLVIASVSNWGGYGLVAAMSKIAGRNLLPGSDDEARMVQGMIEAGAGGRDHRRRRSNRRQLHHGRKRPVAGAASQRC